MKLGDKGKTVKMLQTKLAALGYDVGTIDGVFGAKTDAAVRKLQANVGLVVDGDAGPQTLARLDENAVSKVVNAATRAAESKFDASGWYRDAIVRPCPLRMGGAIEPKGATVHTTDCMPGTMSTIIKRWQTFKDAGAGAHFFLGRTAPTLATFDEEYPSTGLVQIIPITRNGNHAGGPNGQHGRVVTPDGTKLHPNLVYVGIEIDCAGKLHKPFQKCIHPDTCKLVDDADVYYDERGKPWHRVTDYQLQTLGKLLTDLDAVMGHLPAGSKISPNGSYQLNGCTWAALPGTRFVTHVSLDPIRKTDPGPQVTAWLREHFGR